MFKIDIKDGNRYIRLDVHNEDAELSQVLITSDDEGDLLKTNRYRTKIQRLTWVIYHAFREQIRVHIRAILHNTNHTAGEIRHIIERYTRTIPYGSTFEERVELLTASARLNPVEFATDLVRLEQRAADLDAQLLGMSLIAGDPYQEEAANHRIKNLVSRCVAPFWDNLFEQEVKINYTDVENISARVDFRLFNCAMYHFFDNVRKYVKPDSEIIVTVTDHNCSLNFDMVSRTLEEGEQDKIFHESFSGRNAGAQKGEGFGMYIFAQVLKKIGAEPEVTWPPQVGVMIGRDSYQRNVFTIRFPEGTLTRT